MTITETPMAKEMAFFCVSLMLIFTVVILSMLGKMVPKNEVTKPSKKCTKNPMEFIVATFKMLLQRCYFLTNKKGAFLKQSWRSSINYFIDDLLLFLKYVVN